MLLDDQPEQISLIRYVRHVVVRWRVIAIACAVSVISAVLYLHMAAPEYMASMAVAPSKNGQTSGSLGGLASLAGSVGLRSEEVSNMTRFEYLLGSRLLAHKLEAKHHVIEKLKLGRMDPQTHSWKRPSGPIVFVKGVLKYLLGMPAWTPPSDDVLAGYVESHVKVTKSADSGIRTLVYYNKDPAFAAAFLTWVHDEVDGIVRSQAQGRLRQEVEYLANKLNGLEQQNLRMVFINLLQDRESSLLLTYINSSYAADVLEPAFVSDTPVRPRPPLILMGAFVVGLALGIGLTIILPQDVLIALKLVSQDSAQSAAMSDTSGDAWHVFAKRVPEKPAIKSDSLPAENSG